MDEALARLAAAAGIAPDYWDGLGTHRELHERSARGLLTALGFDADGDLDGQCATLAAREFAATLPAALCVTAGAVPAFEIGLAVERARAPLAWRLQRENGAVTDGTSALAGGSLCEPRSIDGVLRGRYRLSLAAGLALEPGYHLLELLEPAARCVLIAVPERCHLPAPLAAGERRWGLAVQLYALRSARNWGMGDFTDLACLARLAGAAGADFIGLNPLHARHLVRPEEASPYAPSSRLWLDPLYLDVEAIAEFADCAAAHRLVAHADFQAALTAARAVPLVDHAAIAALKLPVLAALHASFRQRATQVDDARVAEFRAFVRDGGAALQGFATFEALRLWRREQRGEVIAWRAWPAEWGGPDAPALVEFRVRAAERIEFQCYLQWQSDVQLAAATEAAHAAGMRIGLYRDLAVGAADDGAESWCEGDLIARGASVGAPPDLLNREGQDWGLPPWTPRALAARAAAPWREVLAANMRHAGALRIDHVMALTRLFWIPAGMTGADGSYVRNAFDLLLGVLVLESVRNQCLVIGEDLGSVPDGLRETLAARGLLSYRVLLFERQWSGDGSFKRPWEYPAQALATVVTHDMAPIADYWAGGDIPRRAALGLFPDPGFAAAETARREHERSGLLALLDELQLRPPDPCAETVAPALQAVVARSNAMLVSVQLDDVLGEVEPINIPGTYREYPNWRRKLGVALEALATDPRWQALPAAMASAGRGVRHT